MSDSTGALEEFYFLTYKQIKNGLWGVKLREIRKGRCRDGKMEEKAESNK